MPLFKAFKTPKVEVSIDIPKDSFVLGETVTGNVMVTADEELQAEEVRVELLGIEEWDIEGVETEDRVIEETNGPAETVETRIYGEGDYPEFETHVGGTKLSGKLNLTRGCRQSFPFQIFVASNLGPSYEGQRMDGTRLERTWTLRGVVAVGGRPDATGDREIKLARAPEAVQPWPIQ